MTDISNFAMQENAHRHLWMHFTRMSETNQVPIIVRGEGVWVYDQYGKRYLDGLSGLFTSQVGHGRTELAEAAARQAGQLAYFPIWSYAHPMAIELADRLAELTPGDCNRIFFTTGGSEAVESAWKLARQFFAVTGQPERKKVISRNIAYHGATMGALSITGVTDIKTPFEPLVAGAVKVPNTNFYRAPYFADDLEAFGRPPAERLQVVGEVGGPVEVGIGHLDRSGNQRLEGRLDIGHPGDGQRSHGGAVVGDVPADHLLALGLSGNGEELPGQLPGRLHRLGATGGEEDPVAVSGGQLCQAVGELDGHRVGVAPDGEVGELAGLAGRRFGQLGAAVAHLAGEQPGEPVEIALPVLVVDPHPFSTDDDRDLVGLGHAGEVHPEVAVGILLHRKVGNVGHLVPHA